MPPELDWDLWLGPAPARPFSSVYVPGRKEYHWWDSGNGTMSDPEADQFISREYRKPWDELLPRE